MEVSAGCGFSKQLQAVIMQLIPPVYLVWGADDDGDDNDDEGYDDEWW